MNNVTTEKHQQQPMANRLSVPLCKNNMNTTAPYTTNRHRLQSSSSCYSYISNASSTRTHRRCSIEVGSVLFANDNNSYRGEGPGSTYYEEHATTAMDTYPKRSTATQESYSVFNANNATCTQEMRSPADQPNIVSPSASSQVRVAVNDNPLAWLASPFSKSSSRKEEEEAAVVKDSTTQAVICIKELSFDFSSPRDVNCIPDKKHTVTPSSPSEEKDIEEDVSSYRPVSPPLPPKISRIGMDDPISNTGEVPVQVMHNRNRARSTSISEMSASYLNEFFDATKGGVDDYSSSTSSSLTCEENENDNKNEKKTIECSMPQQALTPRCHPVSLWNQNRGRSSTMESDVSSYISSESSCSSDDDDEEEEQVYIIEDLDLADDDDDLLIRQDSGNLSLQDNTYHTDEVDNSMVLRPRLTEENLREWNVICTKQSIVTKDQYIFRSLSCPYKMNTLSSSPRQVTDMEYSDVDSEVEEPHLLAGISQTISPSLFSYTNSVASDHQDDVVSELNMELEFLHSTLESSSSGCLASTLACPQAVENGKHHTTKSTVRHRRFKSEPGQIFCNKKIHALPQVNLTFSGSMPSSLKKKPRHQRGQSLCSLPSSHLFDCSSLHCILEEASSSTADDTPLFDLIGFMKRHLETLSTSQVFESGFVMGLVCGLIIPLIFKYMFSRIQINVT